MTLVYCGQTIKMKLGAHVGLDPGHIVLDGDPVPLPQMGTAPNIWPISVVSKWLDGSRYHMVGRYASAQSDIVLDGDPGPLP